MPNHLAGRRRPTVALAVFAVLSLGSVACAVALHQLSDSRARIQQRAQGNRDESDAAKAVQAIVVQQGAAIRDMVLVDSPQDISQAAARFEELGRRFEGAQEHLLALLAADHETTDAERLLISRAQQEQLQAVDPTERVVALALRNEDEKATRILIADVLPHQYALGKALGDLDLAQHRQNEALEEIADRDYALALWSTVLLTSLGTLCIVHLAWFARGRGGRTRGARSAVLPVGRDGGTQGATPA